MAQRTVSFPAPGSASAPPRLSVTSRSGRVEVLAEVRADVEVDGAHRAALERDDDGEHVVVEGRSDHVTIRCPVGTDLFVGTLSGRVELRGRLGVVRITTSSGRVEVAEARSVDVRTRSGTIRVDRCDGVVRSRSTSARVTVGTAGEIDVTSESGTITAESARGARVRSTSGRIVLGVERGATVAVRTVSGRVEISVPSAARPELLLRTVSGRVDAAVPSGDEGTVGVKTVSGLIRIRAR